MHWVRIDWKIDNYKLENFRTERKLSSNFQVLSKISSGKMPNRLRCSYNLFISNACVCVCSERILCSAVARR